MFQWYQDAAMCYAYLADVPAGDDPHSPDSFFSRSRWFTRVWTLQELIAPRYLVFLSNDWMMLEIRSNLATVIEQITGIEEEVLIGWKPLRDVSVAKRMSWASGRQTTRVEDEAYALVGIFDIHMYTLYGEGTRAFHRLQEEILRQIPDQSIFAWGSIRLDPLPFDMRQPLHLSATPNVHAPSFLAPSASHFQHCRNVDISVLRPQEWMARLKLPTGKIPGSIALSSYGVHTHLPLIPYNHHVSTHAYQMFRDTPAIYLALLACEVSNWQNTRVHGMLAAVCYVESSPVDSGSHQDNGLEIFLNSAQLIRSFSDSDLGGARLVVLSDEDLATCAVLTGPMEVKGVYLKADYLNVSRIRNNVGMGRPPAPRLVLSRTSEVDLEQKGYLICHDPTYARARGYDGVLVVRGRRAQGASAIVQFRRRNSTFIPSNAILNRWLARYPAISVLEEGLLDSPDVATTLLPPSTEHCTTTFSDTFFQTPFSSENGTHTYTWKVSLSFVAMLRIWIFDVVPPSI